MAVAKKLDPQHIAARTYNQFVRLLDMLEDEANSREITIPQLLNALKVLLDYDLKALRKDTEAEDVGSTVVKYSRTFQDKADGARRGKANPRSRAVIAFDADDDHDDTD